MLSSTTNHLSPNKIEVLSEVRTADLYGAGLAPYRLRQTELGDAHSSMISYRCSPECICRAVLTMGILLFSPDDWRVEPRASGAGRPPPR